MPRYKAIVEIDLEDEDGEADEVTTIEEAIFQAVDEMLGSAGYAVTGFKSVVIFEGEDDE